MGYDNEFDNKINKLTDFINECNSIVFFGGAGVSTESGIPDFRSKDGLYNQHDIEFDMYEPEYLLSEECLHHKPKVFFEFYSQSSGFIPFDPGIILYYHNIKLLMLRHPHQYQYLSRHMSALLRLQ